MNDLSVCFLPIICVYQLKNVDNDLCNPTRVNIESTYNEVTTTTVLRCVEATKCCECVM